MMGFFVKINGGFFLNPLFVLWIYASEGGNTLPMSNTYLYFFCFHYLIK